MDNEFLKVLEAREKRWNMRRGLAEKRYNSIVTATLCVPLSLRTGEEFRIAFLRLCRKFCKKLYAEGIHFHFECLTWDADGPAFFISSGAEAAMMKKVCMEAEETIPGGRLLDIDVMDRDGVPVSREDIGVPPRKCFICAHPAALCVSRRLHSREEVYSYAKKLKNQVVFF